MGRETWETVGAPRASDSSAYGQWLACRPAAWATCNRHGDPSRRQDGRHRHQSLLRRRRGREASGPGQCRRLVGARICGLGRHIRVSGVAGVALVTNGFGWRLRIQTNQNRGKPQRNPSLTSPHTAGATRQQYSLTSSLRFPVLVPGARCATRWLRCARWR